MREIGNENLQQFGTCLLHKIMVMDCVSSKQTDELRVVYLLNGLICTELEQESHPSKPKMKF